MKTKLIMVEGLPGFGKSTTSRMLHEIPTERNIEATLVMEGDADHPADYEGTACLTEEEFGRLLQVAGPFKEILIERAAKKGSWYLLPYQKLKNEYEASMPDDQSFVVQTGYLRAPAGPQQKTHHRSVGDICGAGSA